MTLALPLIVFLRLCARLAQPNGLITGGSVDAVGTGRHLQVAAVICA